MTTEEANKELDIVILWIRECIHRSALNANLAKDLYHPQYTFENYKKAHLEGRIQRYYDHNVNVYFTHNFKVI